MTNLQIISLMWNHHGISVHNYTLKNLVKAVVHNWGAAQQ